ncbi:hypothetical protein [Streptomyces sp. I05A-00742]|uniref:hypothetical protein n=1 Tax=Streptomyces sp. I05A-00742 TaxID=2732853 RepID=UPI0014881385|nr:hypothetical protein [Streptomyces sp. I05A-00742]
MNRLDQVVTKDVCRADQQAVEQRIGQVEAGLAHLRGDHKQMAERTGLQRREDREHAAAARRLVLSSFVAPLLVMVLQPGLASKGSAS